jgi:hypothetical protein
MAAMVVHDDVSPRTTLADEIAAGEFLADDLQELRLGLVMTGGVSLAVWMGGAAHELSRLIRANRREDPGYDPTYLNLLRLTRSLPRIDVIAGTARAASTVPCSHTRSRRTPRCRA